MARKLAIRLGFGLGVFFGGHSWSYEDTAKWCSVSKICCNGQNQSPIDFIGSLRPISGKIFKFREYDSAPKEMKAQNNGHSVKFTIPDSKARVIGGGMARQYIFDHLHFHWGDDKKGLSEHTLSGQPFDMELHIVHFGDSFASTKEAIKSRKPDALAVLGVWIKEGDENENYKPLVESLSKIKYEGETTDVVNPPALRDLLPDNISKYYRYQGSLTTPNCEEVVTWTMFETPVALSKKQIAEFQSLSTGNSEKTGTQMLNNCRPPQNLNGREVLLINA